MFTKTEILASLYANRCTETGRVWKQEDGSTFKIIREGKGYNVRCLSAPKTIRECLRPMFLAARAAGTV